MNVENMKGKILISVTGMEEGETEVRFADSEGVTYLMYHEQDCCENVYLADVCGDVDDLLGEEILHFEERIEGDPELTGEWDESQTWTFYDIQTRKGSVNLRWIGESNGYYSESVDFAKL